MIILVLRLCLRYCILYKAKREGSASINHEATARGADAVSLQWAKPAGRVADGGGLSEINPVASGRYLADCGWLTYHAASRLALYKGKAGEGGSTARTPRAISCNDEEKEEQDKEAAFNKSSSSRLAA
jgi:hypothetical protein